MPIDVEIEPSTGIAIVAASGSLSGADAEAAATALWKAPGWNGQAAVWRFESARFDLSPADVRRVAQFIREHQPSPPPRRVAFVTPRDVDFGMARMFEVFREDAATSFRVFRDLDAAMTWVRESMGDDA